MPSLLRPLPVYNRYLLVRPVRDNLLACALSAFITKLLV